MTSLIQYWGSERITSIRTKVREKHRAYLFSTLVWLFPAGIVWFFATNVVDMLTSVATPALRHMDAAGWSRYVSLPFYCAIVYTTVVLLGALSGMGLKRAILFIEQHVIERVPLIRTVWNTSRKLVISVQEWLQVQGEQGNGFLYAGAFRWGDVILVLPITDIGEYACTLFNPSVPAPTNSEVVSLENKRVVILDGVDPMRLTTVICSTGVGLAALVERFLTLEKEGGHTVADHIARGDITLRKNPAAPGAPEE